MRTFLTLVFRCGTLLVGLVLASAVAVAAPVTHRLTATIDGNPLASSVDQVNGQTRVFTRYRVTQETGFPFVLNQGDTIETTYTVINGGLTLTGNGPGQDETLLHILPINSPFVQSVDNPGSLPVVVYHRTTSLTVANSTGDYAGDSLVTNVLSTSGVPAVSLFDINNFTDTSVTLFNFTISSTFTNIVFQPGFELYEGPIEYVGGGDFVTLDQFSSVSAPGALALFGLSLFGLGARCRAT